MSSVTFVPTVSQPTQGTSPVTVRRGPDRGRTDLGWLQSWHTFSFGAYFDPRHVDYHGLRVINDDVVAPGRGFGSHPHRDMEILSYIVSGALQHKDSMGNGRTIRPGELQYMSAGRGVVHSEFNPSPTEPVHFLQIWLQPNELRAEPRYAELDTKPRAVRDGLALLASSDGREGSIAIRADAELHLGRVSGGATVRVPAATFGHHWLHVLAGQIRVGEHTLSAGDSAAIDAAEFTIFGVHAGENDAELLLFRLA